MSKSTEFVSNAIDQLKYYVYIYSDPDTKIPFISEKGKEIDVLIIFFKMEKARK